MPEGEPVYRLTDHPAPAGKAWVQVEGSQARVIIEAPPGDLLDQADELDVHDLSAALVYTQSDGWHLQPPPALEIAVMRKGGCTARETRDGTVLVCRRPEPIHRGRHKWRPLPVEDVALPEPTSLVGVVEPIEVDVPVFDRASGAPVLLGTEVECAAGHAHDHASTAAACDRAQPAGALQDLTDGELEPGAAAQEAAAARLRAAVRMTGQEPDERLVQAAVDLVRDGDQVAVGVVTVPPPPVDKDVERQLVKQGYAPDFARRKAAQRWRWR